MSLVTANRVLILIFVRSIAINSRTKRQLNSVKNMEGELMKGKLVWNKILKKLRKVWSYSELKEFHKNAVSSLKEISTKISVEVDESSLKGTKGTVETCIICMSNEASAYIVHDGTAHGGFCPTCALETMLSKNRSCPICRKSINGVVLAAEKGGCKCGKEDCRKEIYSSGKIHSNEARVIEKYECEELDKTLFKQKVCRVH